MSHEFENIYAEAVKLSRDERISMAHSLLATVVYDGPPGLPVTKEEILAAAEEVLSGKAETVDAFEFLDKLDRKYSREKSKAA